MKNWAIAVFGLLSYVVGLGGLAYFILFLGSWDFLPVHINSRAPGPEGIAVMVNLTIMMLFGVQHSVTARPGFKQALTRILPPAAERSSYVLLSGVMMLLICFFWMPIEGTLWHADSDWLRILLITGYMLGWVIAVVSTFLINHFELFGLQQVYVNLQNLPEPTNSFTEAGFYRFVRHPLQLGVLIGIWCTPTMTATHFMLALTMTIYIFIGLYFEERDLVRFLGPDYADYQKRVRKLLPVPAVKKDRDKPLVI